MINATTTSPIRHHRENFPVASLLLPQRIRKDILALYRFARHADDIADSTALPKAQQLYQLTTLNQILASPNHQYLPDWARPYAKLVNEGKTDIRHGKALLSAFIQDTTTNRYPSWNALIDYCQRSAAPVGRAILELHKEWYADIEAADNLCNALQILNHLQDLKPDYLERNRIYFPQNWLEQPDYLDGECASETVRMTINMALDRVDAMLRHASDLPGSIRSFRLRAEIYAILICAKRLSQKLRTYDPIASCVTITLSDKLKSIIAGTASSLLHFSPSKDRISPSTTSFFWPLMTLPKHKREAMFALYRWCQAVDDVADNPSPTMDIDAQLAFWQQEIDAMYDTSPTALYPRHPLSRALRPHVMHYQLPRKHLEALVDGQRMDLKGMMNKPSAKTLDRYCHNVASVVGLLSIRIFGYHRVSTEDFAVHTGKGLQLINILRDVREDAGRRRIYLPKELLVQHSLQHITPDNIHDHADALPPVMKTLAKQAYHHLTLANEFLYLEDRHAMRPALLMQHIYKLYLQKLVQQGWDINAPRVRLTMKEKVHLLLSVLRKKH